MKLKKLTRTAVFLALALSVSYLEMLLPPLPLLPPGVKLGLSNIVVMYCLFAINAPSALLTAFLKSFFVFLMRGSFSGLFSLLGGLCSVLMMLFFSKLCKDRISYLMLSVIGAIFHNIGQLLGVCLVLSVNALYYLPILVISGVIMGTLTGTLFRILMPALLRVGGDSHA